MAHVRRRRLPRSAVVWLVSALLVSVSCNPSAAERLAQASKIIAGRIGSEADDVVGAFKVKLTGLSEEAIALQAERTVQKTAWMDGAIARIAKDKIRISRAVHGAACDWLEVSDALAAKTLKERQDKFYAIIATRLKGQGLSVEEAQVHELWSVVADQVDALRNGGTIDLGKLTTDFACLF